MESGTAPYDARGLLALCSVRCLFRISRRKSGASFRYPKIDEKLAIFRAGKHTSRFSGI